MRCDNHSRDTSPHGVVRRVGSAIRGVETRAERLAVLQDAIRAGRVHGFMASDGYDVAVYEL